MPDLYEPRLREHVADAFLRMESRLADAAPTLAGPTVVWMRGLAAPAPAETYFLHERAFPMLLLPWWLGGAIGAERDERFDADVVYSTLNGYYFVRMIDDLMDRERLPEATVLPAMIFFHTEFQSAYQRHFPAGHAFWDDFERVSFASAEAASRDAAVADIDAEGFRLVSARKIAGGKVPIAAVCHHSGRGDLFARWSAFVDLLGCWHQMRNDLVDWSRDLGAGRRTYLLSEAGRRAPGVPTAAWVVTEGLAWGFEMLGGWMEELLGVAADLECPPLVAYLEARQAGAIHDWEALRSELAPLAGLADALRSRR